MDRQDQNSEQEDPEKNSGREGYIQTEDLPTLLLRTLDQSQNYSQEDQENSNLEQSLFPNYGIYQPRDLMNPILLTPDAPLPELTPRIRILEQFRNITSLEGVTSTSFKIEIVNYEGPAVVMVSCVNAEGPPLAHPHNLVGNDCKKGVCTVKINENDSRVCMLENLGVEGVMRRNVVQSLTQREFIRVDPFKLGFQHKNDPMEIDLDAVRLCFQVFVEGVQTRLFRCQLEPVLSTLVYNDAPRQG